MKLSGSEQGELTKAICSAYPTRNDLAMIVKFELEENLEIIVGGDNLPLTIIVSNLIDWAIPKGKLENLIQACCDGNPGNPDLKNFHQKINSYREKEERQQLINILELYFNQEINQILIAYKASLPNRLIDKRIPQNIPEIISGLLLPQQQEELYSYVQKFVGYLLLNSKISPQFKEELKTWAGNNIKQCSQLITQLRQEQQQREQQCNPCLMIAISTSGDNYVVEAWLIKNLAEYHQESFSDCEQLKIENKSEIPTDKTLSNLPKIIIKLINQSLIESNKSIKQIHIFLPSELMNHDFDCWKIEEDDDDFAIGICEYYEVVIRCSERLRGKSPPVFKWREKSTKFKNGLEQSATNIFVLGASDNQKTLFDQVKQDHVIAVKITSIFEKREVLGKIIFKAAIPLALWTRQQIPDIEKELNSIFKNECNDISLKELPYQVKMNKEKNTNDISKHLCLLWDDPDLLPPEQLLTEINL